MQRRWLRNNPHIPGNPCGRGVALLRALEDRGESATLRAERQAWRELRSRGLSRNQVAHMKGALGRWRQLPPAERQQCRDALQRNGGLDEAAFRAARGAAWLTAWAQRVRDTNAAIAAVEMRIEELRAHIARVEELIARRNERAAAGDTAAESGVQADLDAARAAVQDAPQEIEALCARSRDLQQTLAHEFLTECVDLEPDLVRRLVCDGVFRPDDVREFRGFADVLSGSELTAH